VMVVVVVVVLLLLRIKRRGELCVGEIGLG
jgi:hypothetical protein